jgi:hypothetical protein
LFLLPLETRTQSNGPFCPESLPYPDPADLINRAVETLHVASIDLPAFSTLDRLVNRLRAEVHEQMYLKVSQRVTAQQTAVLETLLVKPANTTTTPFNRLKQTPGPATPATIRLWVERLKWLVDLVYSDPLLEGIAYTKLRQFAAEAEALDVGDLRDIAQTGKRHMLLLALVRQARMRCRDELVKMLLRRMRKTQSAAKEQLAELQEGHREIEEKLIGILGQVLETAQVERSDDAFGRQVRELLRTATEDWPRHHRTATEGLSGFFPRHSLNHRRNFI